MIYYDITPERSSFIGSIGYDPITQELLIIPRPKETDKPAESISGYSYQGVPIELAGRFIWAQSLGTFFNVYVKKHFVENHITIVINKGETE